jgi:AraC family transcriptional activator of mtrCDE
MEIVTGPEISMPDVLSDIIATIELRSTLYFRAELTAPFSIMVPEDSNVIRFHVANAGPCYVALETGEHAMMQAGDLVLVSRGAAHVLADAPSERPTALADVLNAAHFDGLGPMEFGGGGSRTSLVCGHFGFGHEIMHPVVASLPPLVHLRGDSDHRYAWLEQLLVYMDRESRARSAAWEEVVKRISEIVFVFVLREFMSRQYQSTAALAALSDPQIGKALSAIHEKPEVEWTVEELAQRAAMSRSIFADRFREALGMTPARYLASWRMHKARALLERSEKSIREIAWEVGYASEPTFNRTFKEQFGAPPGRYRRAAAREESA